MNISPRYNLKTWDSEKNTFTPHEGLSVPTLDITKEQLRIALKELRELGYTAHRTRDAEGCYDDSDPAVLVERVSDIKEDTTR